jgi:DnaJ-class molecular chaperone
MAPKIDCHACGGEGWLPSLPEGKSECPYCKGSGKVESRPLRKES